MTNTKRYPNPGAEAYLGKEIRVHELGLVVLRDFMGNDDAIADSARTSYQSGTRSVSDNTGLIRYLRRCLHTSPSEQVELSFYLKMPIAIWAQGVRHRTANVNQESARYSVIREEFYVPGLDYIKGQSTTNNQGRSSEQFENADRAQEIIRATSLACYEQYQRLLDMGTARETARFILPQNIYTSVVWKCDLHNMLHFLRLRLDSHAQQEIRDYANAIAEVVQAAFPISYKAFEDYVLNAETFSSLELAVLRKLINATGQGLNLGDIEDSEFPSEMSKREIKECRAKLQRLY